MFSKKSIIVFSVIAACLCSCTQRNKPIAAVEKNLKTVKILFPEFSQLLYVALSDTFNFQQYYSEFLASGYKIVVYADSLRCFECDMKLTEWKLKIKELKIRNIDVKIFFLLNSIYFQNAKQIIDREIFNVPLFFESDKFFTRTNNLPQNIERRTFLLNNENEIIIIGSPIDNENLWEKYTKKITKVGDID